MGMQLGALYTSMNSGELVRHVFVPSTLLMVMEHVSVGGLDLGNVRVGVSPGEGIPFRSTPEAGHLMLYAQPHKFEYV